MVWKKRDGSAIKELTFHIRMTDQQHFYAPETGIGDQTNPFMLTAPVPEEEQLLLSATSTGPVHPLNDTMAESLVNLPSELLALIIRGEYLTVNDLVNLRLICKQTKHFASSALGRRLFVDLKVWDKRNAFNWFTNLLRSDSGTHVQSFTLFEWRRKSGRTLPPKNYVHRETETKPDYSCLQDISVMYCGDVLHDPVRSWKKAVSAAVHLKAFRFVNSDEARSAGADWLGVYPHKFRSNDGLLSSIRSDSLRVLMLSHVHVSADKLKSVLEIHKETLSVIDIRSCMLVEGKWLEILDWTKTNLPRLQTLHLDVRYEAVRKKDCTQPLDSWCPLYVDSYRARSPYALVRHRDPLRLRLEGQQKILDGLSELLSIRERVQVL
ncbi:unnamed protein product [Aureobasidium uvarum]|uniref:F-box domain-containing protein n=1 Tax=Aureobasidium uvarum TaxID=2773716 RepID=A0A9N8KX17_9PEZI|nr:unnamed protein product [Aureobasidium uvarum]